MAAVRVIMSNNLSKGPLQILTNDPIEINAVLQRIREELDAIQGLRGKAIVYDRQGVSDPLESGDAVNLGTANLGAYVTLKTVQTINGVKTFVAAIRFVDSNGTLIHSFGTIV